MISKKAQVWGFDLIVAMIIFIIGMASFFLFYQNYSNDFGNSYESLVFDGNSMMDLILSEGMPFAWNSTNVEVIGILSENKINKTKLELFYEITKSNYASTKAIFNTRYDYLFFMESNFTIANSSVRSLGKPNTNPEEINAENLIKINRITVLDNKPVGVYLYVWEA